MAEIQLGIREGYVTDSALQSALEEVERKSAEDQLKIKKNIYTIDGKSPLGFGTLVGFGLTCLLLAAGIIPLLIGGLPLLGLTAIPLLLAAVPAFKVVKDFAKAYEQGKIKETKINNRKLGEIAEKEKLYQEDQLKRQDDEIKRNPQRAFAEAPSRSGPARKTVTLAQDAVATSPKQGTLPQAFSMAHPATAASNPVAVAPPGGAPVFRPGNGTSANSTSAVPTSANRAFLASGASSHLSLGHVLASNASATRQGPFMTPPPMPRREMLPLIGSGGERSPNITPTPFNPLERTGGALQGDGLHHSATRPSVETVSPASAVTPDPNPGGNTLPPHSTPAGVHGGSMLLSPGADRMTSPMSLPASGMRPAFGGAYSTPHQKYGTPGPSLSAIAYGPASLTPMPFGGHAAGREQSRDHAGRYGRPPLRSGKAANSAGAGYRGGHTKVSTDPSVLSVVGRQRSYAHEVEEGTRTGAFLKAATASGDNGGDGTPPIEHHDVEGRYDGSRPDLELLSDITRTHSSGRNKLLELEESLRPRRVYRAGVDTSGSDGEAEVLLRQVRGALSAGRDDLYELSRAAETFQAHDTTGTAGLEYSRPQHQRDISRSRDNSELASLVTKMALDADIILSAKFATTLLAKLKKERNVAAGGIDFKSIDGLTQDKAIASIRSKVNFSTSTDDAIADQVVQIVKRHYPKMRVSRARELVSSMPHPSRAPSTATLRVGSTVRVRDAAPPDTYLQRLVDSGDEADLSDAERAVTRGNTWAGDAPVARSPDVSLFSGTRVHLDSAKRAHTTGMAPTLDPTKLHYAGHLHETGKGIVCPEGGVGARGGDVAVGRRGVSRRRR